MDELNELPQGWKWVRLGDVCENTATRNPSLESDFYYVDISSVDNEIKKIVSPKLTLGKEASSRARKVILENDVIVSTIRPNLNAVAIIPTELNNQIASTGFCILRAKYNLLDNQYLFSFVKSSYFVENLSDEVKGALYPAVTDKQVFAQYIPLPPFPEQQRLATLLTAKLALIEQAKEKITAQLQAVQELTAAYLREVFESEEAKGWEWVKLGDIAIKISKGESPEWQGFSYTNTGIRFIRSENIQWGSFSDIKKTFIPLEFHNKLTRSKVTGGDILINLVGASIGRVCKCPDNIESANINQAVAVISLSNYNSDFLVNFILTNKIQEHFKNVQVDVARPNISLTNLRDLPIPSISTDKQTQLANYLSEKLATVEQLKATLQTQLDSINQLPAALLKQAFSGKL